MRFGIERSFRRMMPALVLFLCVALSSALGQQRTPNDNLRSPEVDPQAESRFVCMPPKHSTSGSRPKAGTLHPA